MRDVLDAIDDALVIRQRHPVLFARMSRMGLTCFDLREMYGRWLVGDPSIPSWANAFNPSNAVRRRKNSRRS